MCKSVPQIVVWLSRRSRLWAPLSGFGALPGLSSLDPGLDEAPSGAWATHWRTSRRRLPRLTDRHPKPPGFENRIFYIDNLRVLQYTDPEMRRTWFPHAGAGAARRSPASEVGLRLYIVGEYGNVNYEMDISCVLHKQRPAAEFPCQSAADRVFRLQNRPEIRCRQGRQNRVQVIDIQSVSDVERALLRG